MSASLRFPRPSGKTKTSPTVELRRAFAIPPSLSKHLQTVLDTAIRISGDMGNLQLYDPRSHSLRIVVQRGFGPAFLHFFDSTGEGQAACGRALLQRERVVVEDVANDPVFTDDDVRRAVLNAGARAVYSTPLLGSSGDAFGVLSTHWRKRGRPSVEQLRVIDHLARSTAKLLEQKFSPGHLHLSAITRELDLHVPGDGSLSTCFELFNRTASGVPTWVHSFSTIEEATGWLKGWPAKGWGELVLFQGFDVVAVASQGTVDLRSPIARPSDFPGAAASAGKRR